jgi:hypothetical protein
MIRTIADLLLQLKERESLKLESAGIKHAPTIGDMYEGLSRHLLGLALPGTPGLQLSSGFIVDDLGRISGQIDCMIVRGEGTKIPYTNDFKWHVKDVIAVIEIKKSLYGRDLADAFDHLHDVHEIEFGYLQARWQKGDTANVSQAVKAFAELTGTGGPRNNQEISSMDPRMRLVFQTLAHEQLQAIRIIFGFGGYQSQRNFRKAVADIIEKQVGVPGRGVLAFPQLITSGRYSLVKTNGMPFSTSMIDGKWPFCSSSSANPILLMLEYIWTRLEREYQTSAPWGEDLENVELRSFLFASPEQQGEITGWKFTITEETGHEPDGSGYADWEPARITSAQFIAIQRLCDGRPVRLDDTEMIEYLRASGIDADDFRESLLKTGLVALRGEELQLITEECQCIILPNGEFIAGENNTGRLTRWLERWLEQNGQSEGSQPGTGE